MYNAQRAFARKLNKRGNAEVRQQVSSAHFADLPQSISSINLAANQNVDLADSVDPPDFEECLLQQQISGERDLMHFLQEFPEDDLAVELIPREVRTVVPIGPERGTETDAHVRDCTRHYTSDYTSYSRKYSRCAHQHWTHERDGTLKSSPKQEYDIDIEESHKENSSENSSVMRRTSIHMNDTPRNSWASSIFDLKNSQADNLLKHLLDRAQPEDVDFQNEEQRMLNRQDALFDVYPPQLEDEIIEKRDPAHLPHEHFGHRIMVKCLQLKLDLEIEPIFACMALYDAKEKKKISENFYFDMTPEHIKKLLHPHISYQDISTLSRSCIFSITHPSPDIFLVVKLEKVLQQGDISEAAEPYIKEDRNRDRVRQAAAYYCDRLGAYRMPFAWTAAYLMNVVAGSHSMETDYSKTDSLDRKSANVVIGHLENLRKSRDESFTRHSSVERTRSGGTDKRNSWSPEEFGASFDNFRPVTLTVSSLFKQETDKLGDEDLYKFLNDLKRPSSLLRKLKCIPGTLKLDISPCPDEPKYCLTPELYRIKPYPDDKGRPVKEVVEFPVREVYQPNTLYRNLLYIYPKYLNFTNRQGSARNIAVKVQLMSGEEEQCAMSVIFGKSGCPEFASHAYATVTYHSKNPYFYEEVKCKLPAKIEDKHHILFTFYHISCQKKAQQENTPIETPIGYTWLPLLREGRLMTGEVSFPVSLEKPPPNYSVLHPDVQLPGMKWVDNHKPLFSVSIQAVSSVHTLDQHLDRFFNLVHAAESQKIPPRIGEMNFEAELKRAVCDVVQARAGSLVSFLSLVLDKLLRLMCRPPVISGQVVNVSQSCFEAMTLIVRRIQCIEETKADQHCRNALLTTYIEFSSSLPHPESAQISPQTPTSGYATLGRPVSLPVSRSTRHRSSSDPDLPGSNPNSPDIEVAGFIGGGFKGVDRAGSFRQQEPPAHLPRLQGRKLVHEEIAYQWVVSSGSTKELALQNAWFFFELMVKSMAEHLDKEHKLYTARKSRFPQQYLDDVFSLFMILIKDVTERYSRDYTLIQSLNNSLAFFLLDCFSLMDRGFVFVRIKEYCRVVYNKYIAVNDATTLISLKLDFLRIVCSHEHYVTLNLPTANPTSSAPSSPTPSISSTSSQMSLNSLNTLVEKGLYIELSTEYRMQHYLAALVLCELDTALMKSNESSIHYKAINVLRNLLSSHDADSRYKEREVKARVALLYLPLVGIVMNIVDILYNPNDEVKKNVNPDERIDQTIAQAISGSTVYGPATPKGAATQRTTETPESPTNEPERRSKLSQECTRNLLCCFLWVLKNVEQQVIRSWWLDSNTQKLILDVLYLCQLNFEYKPYLNPWYKFLDEMNESLDDLYGHEGIMTSSFKKSGRGTPDQGKKALKQYPQQLIKKSADMKSRLEEAILGSGSARSDMMARRRQYSGVVGFAQATSSPSVERESSSHLRWRKDQTQWKQASDSTDGVRPRMFENSATVEGNLACEANLIILDTLEIIIQIMEQSDHLMSVLPVVLKVLLNGLSLNQSSLVLVNMFATQRAFVSKFPELLFEEETEQCADLCLRLLRHCSSPIANTRCHASGSLYMLMRHNFEKGNNFARVKMQVTMSLSSLVGQNQRFNEEHLRRSLKTILTYAEEDHELQETPFPEQVQDLIFNLHMILSDTVKMKEFQEDPEMLIDLMYRIAKGYQNSPDLRLTWLQNMAAIHGKRSNHCEAAQCLIHSAGLVAEYLNMLEDRDYLPVGCVAFQHITPNVLEESAVSDDVVSPEEEGICTGKFFTELGLVGLLEQAAMSFSMAGLYEAMNNVYKVLIPIYEYNRDFKKLAVVHEKLKVAFDNIVKQEGKRIFGTYFRVGFYGPRFGDLDGQEFVYKEPAITKLPEISHRLESFYGERFGEANIDIIKDSNSVEQESLDPEKAYIQITYVEPYFDLYEFKDRKTFFDLNYNLKRFMYATPFTEHGKAHGELMDQCKRKTILTTTHSFPYVKTRLAVRQHDQIILTPIEVAIEDVQKKTKELNIALLQEPPDAKMLQMVLQGCIGTTVNQGPVEVAKAFLGNLVLQNGEGLEGSGKSNGGTVEPTKHHHKLRISLKDFIKKCEDALKKNETLIGPDQKEYQRELKKNYENVREKLTRIFTQGVNGGTSGQKKKHKRDKHHHSEKRRSYAAQKLQMSSGSLGSSNA